MTVRAPAEPRELVDEIVATLVSRFQPRRIYLFGSRARDDSRPDSDYDFLIEIETRPEGVMITRQGMTWLNDFPDSEIQVHVRYPGALERKKDDPGTVDWDVIREGRLLFALPGLPAINPGPNRTTVRERPADVPDSFAGWLVHAERDMRAAAHLSSDLAEFKETICFHAQQAAEKFVKALIISRHAHPPRTHDLIELLAALRKLGIDFGDLDDDARFFAPFAVEVRYREDRDESSQAGINWRAQPVEVTESDARRALAVARLIEAAVRPHLP
ncbi:MAG: HEPN domain-containing protein [Gemmatimonadaceae bacterium]